jgi:hypothetical protein
MLIPRIPSLLALYLLQIADLIHADTMTWKSNFLHSHFHSGTVLEIIKISLRSDKDLLLWTPSTTGVFSTKSAHHLLASSIPSPPLHGPKSSWKSYESLISIIA